MIGGDGMLGLVMALAAGGAVGLAYFAGLWATVRALPAARHPALLVLGSFVARFAAAAATFILLVRTGGLPWLATGLAGFVLARSLMVRRRPPSATTPTRGAA